MEWLNPIAHVAWIGVAFVALLIFRSRIRRRRDRDRFGTSDTVERLAEFADHRRRRVRSGLLVAGVAFLALALAGPRFGSSPREVSRAGLDLVVALDVSASMLAEDVAPSRLERARHELKQMADQLHGDRLALVTFAGDAFIQMPLSSDRNAFHMFLDVASPDQIPTPGTDFTAMLSMARRAFAQQEVEDDRSRVLLVVSDGENHAGGLDAALRELRDAGITTFAVGVGERNGARIPLRTTARGTEYRRDRRGEIVRTRLEDDVLRQISGNDRYYEIGRSSNTFGGFQGAIERLQRAEIEATVYEDYDERFQWPLLIALVLLFAERAIPERKQVPQTRVEQT